MGYETKLIVGQLGSHCPEIDGDSNYLLKIATLDLCKCGSGELSALFDKAQKSKDYKKAHWGDLFSVRQDKVVAEILEKKKHSDIKLLLGKKESLVEMHVKQLSKLFEGWESETKNDSYGDRMKAIPIKEVFEAIQKGNERELKENGGTYRRYDIALALLESLIKAFPEREVLENGHDANLYCVLYGY